MDSQPLLDAFAGLSLDMDEHRGPEYHSVSEDEESDGPSLFQIYKKHPANAFQRPIYYRVVHSESPPEVNGSLRSRLFPPPEFDTLKLPELKDHVQRHAQEMNRVPTPFISMTDDILRAINIAFCRYICKKDVTILLVDPWKLEAGSYLKCNAIRSKIGIGHENIYNTEILVWAKVPSDSILCRWERSHISDSGLFDALPSLRDVKSGTTLKSLRDVLPGDDHSFSPAKVATSLAHLGMDPSRFQIKQVFLFLLGAVKNYRVEKGFKETESKHESRFPLEIQDFEQAVYQLSLTLGRKELISYYRNDYKAVDSLRYLPRDKTHRRKVRKALSLWTNNHFCPGYEDWWVSREESDLSDWEAEFAANHEGNGLNKWLMRNETLTESHLEV